MAKKRWVVLCCQGSTHEASQEKPHGADPKLSPGLGVDTGPDGHDRGRASQFDPTIDKERKFISNLRWNMLVCAQTLPTVSLREQLDGKTTK